MDDAAVVAGLMRSDPVLLVQDGDRGLREEFAEPARHCQADDAGPRLLRRALQP